MAESDAAPEYEPTTNVSGLTGKRERDGTLKAVELRVEYFESREVEPEEFEFRNECEADLRYAVTDGVASLARVSDHSNGMHGDGANSTAPALLRTLPAGERAVETVPGVERVERAEETLGAVIEDGRAEFDDDR
jgi:hypothetical protein